MDRDLPAGDFSDWLAGARAAIEAGTASDVPCGSCTACCRSSQFVHIGPDETDALAHVPAALRFPAPGLPAGHVILGYDERGHCPMLVDDRCSIYEHRPRACRVYDCRVFPAAGVEPEPGQPAIAERARRWRFSYADADDEARHEAVRAAADGLRDQGPAHATQLAVAAVTLKRRNPGFSRSGAKGPGAVSR